MFKSEVSKDVLQSKIKEEISKLEKEWEDEIYRYGEDEQHLYVEDAKLTKRHMYKI